jgi:hypothetical protein
LRKHVDAHHAIVSKRFEEEMNSLMQGKEDKNQHKKDKICFGRSVSKQIVTKDVFGRSISKQIVVKGSFKKDDV